MCTFYYKVLESELESDFGPKVGVGVHVFWLELETDSGVINFVTLRVGVGVPQKSKDTPHP